MRENFEVRRRGDPPTDPRSFELFQEVTQHHEIDWLRNYLRDIGSALGDLMN